MSLNVYELTAESGNRHDSPGAVILDSVTDVPLPLQLFNDHESATHFLLWTEREKREPFGPSLTYDVPALKRSQQEWWDRYMGEDGNLNALGQAELEAVA